jgi:hypothetical protein
VRITFDLPAGTGAVQVGRTHPIVSAYCDTVLGKALSPEGDERFARCGAIFTHEVELRTAIALLRLRYILRDRAEEYAEEVVLAAFRRQDGQPVWLQPWVQARELLAGAEPTGNMEPGERAEQVRWALDLLDRDSGAFEPVVAWRTEQLRDANYRLRSLVRARPVDIVAHRPPDVLGIYVLVPGSRGGQRR